MRSRRGVWRVNYTPKLKKRTALLRKLKDVFRRYQSQPVDRVVKLINPILRGWVNYFSVGHSSECFSFIQDWVEKKVRRHMGRAQNRKVRRSFASTSRRIVGVPPRRKMIPNIARYCSGSPSNG
jgi:Group II intron, maturase-specific domain